MIRPYLSDIINDHKNEGKWKIQLAIAINFIFSKDSDEICIMRSKSDNIAIMRGSEKDEIIEELFKTILQKYQEGLEESIKGSEFIFDSANVLNYDLNKLKSR